MKKHKLICLIITLIFGGIVGYAYLNLGDRLPPQLFIETLSNNLVYTGVRNIVMTVYLNYRLFDTIFETMLLLVCVMGVLQFSQLNLEESKYIDYIRRTSEREKFSSLMTDSLRAVYPFVFIFGIYIIISGINTPGGGFQGGAIIAAIIMSLHLSTGRTIITLNRAVLIEKLAFIIIIIIAALFMVFSQDIKPLYYRLYLIFVNIFIGVKVFSGFVILYLQFMNSGKVVSRDKDGGLSNGK